MPLHKRMLYFGLLDHITSVKGDAFKGPHLWPSKFKCENPRSVLRFHVNLQGLLYFRRISPHKALSLIFWAGMGWLLASKRSPREESGLCEPVSLANEGATQGEYTNL